jgi:predicted transglutaminase-like cysteine proteinase
MGFVRVSFLAAAAFMAISGLAQAAESSSHFTREFGNTKPPVGFVKFCAKNPEECKPKSSTIFRERLEMTPEMWDKVFQVNAYVNGKISPVSDQDLYGEAERWTYPIDAGDCEDYVLLKKRTLEQLGFAPGALLITVVLDEKREGHAVLTVSTKVGDYILDNRRNDILRWNDTRYTYLKRQSDSDPLAWVSLSKQEPVNNVVSTKSDGEN